MINMKLVKKHFELLKAVRANAELRKKELSVYEAQIVDSMICDYDRDQEKEKMKQHYKENPRTSLYNYLYGI